MRGTATVCLFLLLIPAAVRGQSPGGPVSRADVAVSAGWFAADRSFDGDCCASLSSGLFKGVSAGYYWTDHLKTEAAVSRPGVTESYYSLSDRLPNGSTRYISDQHHYDSTKFSIAQAYQFGRNSTFHPFAVAGIDVDLDRDTISRYLSSTSSSPGFEQRVETTVRTRAFAGAGFKAYVSERAFFKGEARFAGVPRFDQMTWTAGVGIDLGTHPRPSAAATAPPHAVPRGQEPVDVWRAYASLLPIGSLLDVTPAGAGRVIAELMAVDADGILLKPLTRVPEPVRHVNFSQLEMLALHEGPRPGSRVGATLIGVGAGAGAFTLLMTALFSHFSS